MNEVNEVMGLTPLGKVVLGLGVAFLLYEGFDALRVRHEVASDLEITVQEPAFRLNPFESVMSSAYADVRGPSYDVVASGYKEQ